MDLTILIPTFDRPSEANQRLEEILSEFGSGINVVVQVNPGRYSAANISRHSGLKKLLIRENQSNIGFVANIVSGMSSVHTEWVWVLGDDDPIRPGSHEEISSSMRICNTEHAGMAVFNQWHQPQCQHDKICRNVNDFAKATGFSDCLFISALVWRASFLEENFGILIDYSFTRASQAVIQLSALARGTCPIYVRNHRLIDYIPVHRWSRLDYLHRVDKIFYESSLRMYKAQILGFMLPQLSWALSSSIDETESFRALLSWFLLSSKYAAHVFRNLGLGKGVAFSSMLFSIVLGYLVTSLRKGLHVWRG